MRKNHTIKLNIACGLANRLRTIAYFYNNLKENEILNVVWNWDDLGTPGEFYDFFNKVDDLNFVKDTDDEIMYTGNGHGLSDIFDYDFLELKKEISDDIEEQKRKLDNEYVAIHVRRTDIGTVYNKFNIKYDASDYTTYFKFIDKHPKKNLYIASDNKESYDLICDKYKNTRLINNNVNFLDTNARRKTSMRDTVIDLYMCINSHDFRGTAHSTFTDFIVDARKSN